MEVARLKAELRYVSLESMPALRGFSRQITVACLHFILCAAVGLVATGALGETPAYDAEEKKALESLRKLYRKPGNDTDLTKLLKWEEIDDAGEPCLAWFGVYCDCSALQEAVFQSATALNCSNATPGKVGSVW